MNVIHYIGFDVHKKTTSYCVKAADGTIVEDGKLRSTRLELRGFGERRPHPWKGAMEATLFSGWTYDTLMPFAVDLRMGHPALMKAIGASKKKNDRAVASLERLVSLVCNASQEIPSLRACARVFSLDMPLSWMSYISVGQ